MKKIFFALLLAPLLFSSALLAVSVKAGWNIIGVSTKISLQDLKKNYALDEAYLYQDNEWKQSGTVNPSDGVFVKAKEDFELYFGYDTKTANNTDELAPISSVSVTNNTQKIDKTLDIKKGWNLKALSMDTAVMARLFEDDEVKVWSYSPIRNAWVQFNSKNNETNNFVINTMQGFFIKSPVDREYDVEHESANLKAFKSKSAMEDLLEEMVIYHKAFRSDEPFYPRPYPIGILEDGAPMPVASATAVTEQSKSVEDATNTNTQEEGIDEADIIKHDGNNIFFLVNSQVSHNTFDGVLNGKKSQVLDIDMQTLTSGDKTQNGAYIESMYLEDGKLVVIGTTGYASIYREARSIAPYPQDQSSFVQIFDVSNPDNIKTITTMKIDGSLVDSRLTDGKLYLVSRFSPYYKVKYERNYLDCEEEGYYYPQDDDGKCFQFDYDKYDIQEKHTIPQITINGKEQDLLKYKKFYASMKVNQSPNITTTLAIDLKKPSDYEVISVMSLAYMIYMSSESLYLTSTDYSFRSDADYSVQTVAYKIRIKDLSYVNNIFIDGTLINQFAMSEYKGVLRMATTQGWGDNTKNAVYTVEESDGKLEQVGSLEGLGKEGERIHSVRFVKDKAFLVTFKRTDPFYTIDLSDPKNPTKAGELSIPGFSTYLHDIGDDQILALGNDADEDGRVTAMQIQLFDVSDFKNPKLLDKYLFDAKSYSGSLYNHKAFTFRQSDKKFAMQVNSYAEKFYGFFVFDVQEDKINELDVISNDEYFYNGRSIIFTKENKDYILMLDKDLSAKELKQ